MTYFIQFDTKMENKCESSLDIGDEMIEPHESLFLVLAYLNLFELLTITKVCKSLRDAVHNDVLLWLDIIVEPPLNSRITDYNLREVTSKAQGRLRTLGLLNCVRVTDDGLQRVVDDNPHISKLYVPACTGMTPNGLVTIITRLTERSNDLKFLRLRNCHNMTKEHLETLTSCLKLNPVQQEQQCQPNMFLQNRLFSPMKKLDTNPQLT
ncbi:hypothetical protein GIB67_001815 [Kingdonia uniflora]|uniref:F-box domain-containing protein n=1 Tax=Kingdonia uniflora TaxID=39325 RepID=A0A7J7LC28_9MAGN|nr:hypothetical protein GIB67_001815 [Kingdonia uniflora]